MSVFIKSQVSSLLATGFDFLTSILLVQELKMPYLPATAAGALIGAGTNFIVNKYWSFSDSSAEGRRQVLRYALVWAGSLALNLLGVYLLTRFAAADYAMARALTAVAVGVGFNYSLQKHYVFRHREKITIK